MENLYSPPRQIKDGKLARFGFCAASFLIWGAGEGWGFAVPLYSVQDCSLATWALAFIFRVSVHVYISEALRPTTRVENIDRGKHILAMFLY